MRHGREWLNAGRRQEINLDTLLEKKKIIACVQANFCHFLEGNEQQPFIGDITENSVSRAVQMLQLQILKHYSPTSFEYRF